MQPASLPDVCHPPTGTIQPQSADTVYNDDTPIQIIANTPSLIVKSPLCLISRSSSARRGNPRAPNSKLGTHRAQN